MNPYTKTLLEKVYTPIFITLNGSPQIGSSVPLLTDSSSEMVTMGAAISVIGSTAVEFASADRVTLLEEALKLVDSLWEIITKKKEYSKVVNAYNNLINSINQDFNEYACRHEECLANAQKSVDCINRQKTIMKDYLLHDLFEILSFSGKSVEFTDIELEHLDLRKWPINNKYDLIKEHNLKLINDLNGGSIHKYMSYLSSICGVALSNAMLIVPRVNPVFGVPFLLYDPIKNRISVQRVKKKLARLEPIARANQADMEADLFHMSAFARALDNVAKIYKSVLDDIRPLMKKVLNDLEFEYAKDFSLLPDEKKMVLSKMKKTLKDLAEKSILPVDSGTEECIYEVCQFSNDLSCRFVELKNLLRDNFQSSLSTN